MAFAGQADRLSGGSSVKRLAGNAGPYGSRPDSANLPVAAIDLPPAISIETVQLEDLPADWRTNTMASREIGDQWLDRAASSLLRVPSAITHYGHNFLLNPAHPDAIKVVVAETVSAPFDARLVG
jgi:RES domain-containing protein